MKAGLITSVAFASLAYAAPMTKRDHLSDADILNYALTLEHLENAFYREGLAKFSQGEFAKAGYGKAFYENLKTVASDEATHVEFLTEALTAAGATPVSEATYDFGYSDVTGFLATASVLEGVGVSAYLGAAASIMEDDYLTAAGSILTVEARHSSYLRSKLKQSPFAQPFDNPLAFNEVFTLAAQFIVEFAPGDAPLPFKPFPAVTATSADEEIVTGSVVKLKVKGGLKNASNVSAAFITVTGPIVVDVQKTGKAYSVTVPEGIAGQSYVVLTDGSDEVNDDTILAGPAVIEIAGTTQ